MGSQRVRHNWVTHFTSWLCITSPLTLQLPVNYLQVCMHEYMLSRFSHIWLFANLWTVVFQAPLSMEFPGKNTGVGCRFLLQGIVLTQELNLHLLCHLHWQAGPLPVDTWKAPLSIRGIQTFIVVRIPWLVVVSMLWGREFQVFGYS